MNEGTLQRSYSDVMALRKKVASEELARAQAPGGPVRVSRMAASLYLNVSYDTLRRWERDGTGPRVDSNSQDKGREWVYYVFKDLQDWVARGAMKPTQRKKAARYASAMREELEHQEDLRRERELELMRQETRRLEKELEALKRKTQALGFATLQDLMVPQDWVFQDGKVLGHVLTVSEEALASAIEHDETWEATLDMVLLFPWVNKAERDRYRAALKQAYDGTERHIDAVAHKHDLREALPEATKNRGHKPL